MKILLILFIFFIHTSFYKLNNIDLYESKGYGVLFKANSVELLSSRDTLVLDKIAAIYKSNVGKYILLESATSENDIAFDKNICHYRFDALVNYWVDQHGFKKEIFRLKIISTSGEVSFMNILIRD